MVRVWISPPVTLVFIWISFSYLPNSHCGSSHFFLLLSSLWGIERKFVNFVLNDKVTPGPYGLVILLLITVDVVQELVVVPCISLVLSVSLLCVLCFGCYMILQMNI